jgi:hypothetical protein
MGEHMLARLSCVTWTATLAFGSLLAAGCWSREPFALVKVSGRITYEDGTLIPAEGNFVRLMFYPQTPPRDSKTNPRPGAADVDLRDGSFSVVTTHRWGDGLTVGKHKVVICGVLLTDVPKGVPPEYNDMTKPLLEVDTSQQPFQLKIRKPR